VRLYDYGLGRESPTLGNLAPPEAKIGRIGVRQVGVGSVCCRASFVEQFADKSAPDL